MTEYIIAGVVLIVAILLIIKRRNKKVKNDKKVEPVAAIPTAPNPPTGTPG